MDAREHTGSFSSPSFGLIFFQTPHSGFGSYRAAHQDHAVYTSSYQRSLVFTGLWKRWGNSFSCLWLRFLPLKRTAKRTRGKSLSFPSGLDKKHTNKAGFELGTGKSTVWKSPWVILLHYCIGLLHTVAQKKSSEDVIEAWHPSLIMQLNIEGDLCPAARGFCHEVLRFQRWGRSWQAQKLARTSYKYTFPEWKVGMKFVYSTYKHVFV